MDTSLLTTKYQIPPNPHRALQRHHLIETLEDNLPHFKLILISAPAGYGKTTLLTQWVHTSRFPHAWLSLSEQDDDLERFLRYLLAGWQQAQPGIRNSPLSLLLGAMSPEIEAVLPAFINAASDNAEHMIFVLDDYHLIEETTIHEALTYLLEHMPPNLHFVLSCRAEPPLPLARYRARNAMLELHSSDLRFTVKETQDFLRTRMGLELATEQIAPIHTQLEGWAAGLQLAALSVQQRGKTEEIVLSGRHRFIADYLSEEVFENLSPDIQLFLLQTSITDRLCASLCEAIIGLEGGQQILETLERDNLFLIALDDDRVWFRYHPIFANFLNAELKRRHPDEPVQLHQRAACWYLDHNLPEQAFPHALEGQEMGIVSKIFENHIQAKLIGGEFRLVKNWLDSLPKTWYSENPFFGLIRIGYLLFTGQFGASLRSVEEVEQKLASSGKDDASPQMARINAMRCSIACFQNDLDQARTFANQAFQHLPDGDYLFRGILLGSLGDTYRRNGLWKEAKACYLEMLDFIEASNSTVFSVHIFGALADLYLRQGSLQDAVGYWNKALDAIRDRESWGHIPLPLIGWVHIRMGEIFYQWNELSETREHLTLGLERAELGGDVRGQIAGYLITSRLELSEGNIDAALANLEQARPLVEKAQFSHWNSYFERLQLELWLAQDRLRAAVNWTDKMLQEIAHDGHSESEVIQLAIVRALIIKGDPASLQQALPLISTLLQKAESEGRMGIKIEALALQALAYDRRTDIPNAMSSLEHALHLAETEGYLRLFIDLGPSMAHLLQEARSRRVMPGYVKRLLDAYKGEPGQTTTFAQTLVEPLTGREQEILGLLAAGLTNTEIADQLVISPETVKKHASNIYGKLGVGSRTEAAAKARELGWFSS